MSQSLSSNRVSPGQVITLGLFVLGLIVCIVAGLVFGYVLSRVSSRYAEETIETEPA